MRFLITEASMTRQWRVCRQVKGRPDGHSRWDRAYQHLLLWSSPTQLERAATTGTSTPPLQEASNDTGSLYPGIDSPPGSVSGHRTAAGAAACAYSIARIRTS